MPIGSVKHLSRILLRHLLLLQLLVHFSAMRGRRLDRCLWRQRMRRMRVTRRAATTSAMLMRGVLIRTTIVARFHCSAEFCDIDERTGGSDQRIGRRRSTIVRVLK